MTVVVLFILVSVQCFAEQSATNPASALMLKLRDTGTDRSKIDFDRLPRVPAKHAIISDVRDRGGKEYHAGAPIGRAGV